VKLEARMSSGALQRQLMRLGAELEAMAVQAAVRAILKNVGRGANGSARSAAR
jgi:hypothetical protein